MNVLYVSAREVFRAGILCGAVSVILLHSYPSGDVEPSPQESW
ncbi:MAG: JAB domain-containing protein [Longimicrobiaceae bacterium]